MACCRVLIREKADYFKLADGTWQAEFPGRQWHVVVTAQTLEHARTDLLAAMDARLFAMLCDALQLTERERPPAYSQSLRHLVRKSKYH